MSKSSRSEVNPPLRRIGILTSGGLAPCLSACVGNLIMGYCDHAKETGEQVELVLYKNGYKGLLLGDSITLVANDANKQKANALLFSGGSPIGNSRVKLTNIADCLKRKLINENEIPLERAARQLQKDNVTVLHTCGGDDTTLQAAEIAKYLLEHTQSSVTVVGLPKTIDNDIYPVLQSLGAQTAAEEGAKFFTNVVNESSANPRMLIIHEIMGRDCGYLTAATAKIYRDSLNASAQDSFFDEIGFVSARKDVHAVYIPESPINIEEEVTRLRKVMDTYDCVNIFISEGANIEQIVDEMRAAGEAVPTDAFGHVKLDAVNPGQWFSKQFAGRLGAEKVLVQKSGYFARSAKANSTDLDLIRRCCEKAVECGLQHIPGCIGEDQLQNGELRPIEFSRIRGARAFDFNVAWYREMQEDLAHTYFSHPAKTIVKPLPRERGY
jgi:diphosphate-dependent phosphofructokinase